MPEPNPYLLAADNHPSLLPLLRSNPSLASAQDDHGYSLVHAASSYNHLDLLRSLVDPSGLLRVPVDLRDEDGETALFVAETVECARLLLELGADMHVKNIEGATAAEKIEEEGEFPEVASYLRQRERSSSVPSSAAAAPSGTPASALGQTTAADGAAPRIEEVLHADLPPVPEGLTITVGTTEEVVPLGDSAGVTPGGSGSISDEEAADPVFRRRIEELAAREDFHTAEGQAELRRLVEDVITGVDLAETTPSQSGRNVRRRLE